MNQYSDRRPAGIAEEDIRRWNRSLDADELSRAVVSSQGETFREFFYAAEWLGEQLIERGCSEDVMKQICYQFGAYRFFDSDVWAEARRRLGEFSQNSN